MSIGTSSRSGRSKTDPRYGQGEHTIRFAADEMLDEAEMTRRILARFNDPSYQPPTLPSAAVELLELSRRPEVSFDDIVALLEQDSMLAGRILKIAQSPVYAGTSRIESLRDALVRLGLKTLRDVVLEVATNLRVFRCPAYADVMKRLSRHSKATAYLSRIVSRYTPMPDEFAFLCGLLHDVGIAGILVLLGDVPRGQTPPDLTMLWAAIDSAHEETVSIMTRSWKLPQEIPLVLGAHHRVSIQGFDHPLAATVCLADQLARDLGMGLSPDEKDETAVEQLARKTEAGRVDYTTPQTLERARDTLGLSEDQLQLIRNEAEELLKARFQGAE